MKERTSHDSGHLDSGPTVRGRIRRGGRSPQTQGGDECEYTECGKEKENALRIGRDSLLD
jgi:hypothetical protein